MIDVGRIHKDRIGAGRLYIPKTILNESSLEHKDQVKLESKDGKIVVTPLKEV